jgi:hypothetical protein
MPIRELCEEVCKAKAVRGLITHVERLARLVPITLFVVLAAPAWASFAFLDKDRRRSVLAMVRELNRWTWGGAGRDAAARPK